MESDVSEARFTKGEWLIVVNDDFMDGENLVVSMDSHIKDSSSFMSKHKIVIEGSGNGDLEAKSNAHLIVAAPKMYKFLDDLANGRSLDYPIEQLLIEARGEHE